MAMHWLQNKQGHYKLGDQEMLPNNDLGSNYSSPTALPSTFAKDSG